MRAANELKAYPVVYSTTVRYRKQLTPFQSFSIESRLLTFDDKNMVTEQKLIGATGFVHAVALCKVAIVGASPHQVFEKAGFEPPSKAPAAPEYYDKWAEVRQLSTKNSSGLELTPQFALQSDKLSSEALRSETTSTPLPRRTLNAE